MNAARAQLLREAEATAAWLRRNGYPGAEVDPATCIANEIGPDNYFTRTISIYVGRERTPPKAKRAPLIPRITSALHRAARALRGDRNHG